ncbi:Spike_receptor binding domain superfamily [Hexamita inflata]|uniref:Coronavirus n=1 Tax=Hexamita inflata TaxID=28002 RepID=A0AA86QND2_9EUKA|nr:Spike receptor binding domain superfamily [Hexamita inflata]
MSVLTENRWLLKFRLAIIVEFSMWNILFSKLFVLSVFDPCIKLWQQLIGICLNIALVLKKILIDLILWSIKKTQNVFLRLNQEYFQQYNYKWYQNQHKCSYTYNNQYLHICKIQQRQSISKRYTTWKFNQFNIYKLKAFYSKAKSIFLVRHSSTFGVKRHGSMSVWEAIQELLYYSYITLIVINVLPTININLNHITKVTFPEILKIKQ